jgi:acyl dehydratase
MAMETSAYTSAPEKSTPVEYNARDLILYALGVGSKDPRFTYENHPDFAAFPTYPIVLFFKGDSFDTCSFPSPTMMAFPSVPLKGVKVGLDAEKIIEKVNELPKEGAKLQLVGSTVGVHKKGSGALVEQELKLQDESGKVYYRLVNGSFLVGAKDFQDSGKTLSQAAAPPKNTPPTLTVEETTSETIPSLYRLSGDYNPLHVDPQFAQMGGFSKPIMHGQCTMGHVARMLMDAVAGGDQKLFKSIQLRFAAPVYPGETLVVEAWKVSPTEYVFQTKVKETGKVCVNNGRLVLSAASKL